MNEQYRFLGNFFNEYTKSQKHRETYYAICQKIIAILQPAQTEAIEAFQKAVTQHHEKSQLNFFSKLFFKNDAIKSFQENYQLALKNELTELSHMARKLSQHISSHKKITSEIGMSSFNTNSDSIAVLDSEEDTPHDTSTAKVASHNPTGSDTPHNNNTDKPQTSSA